MKKRNEEDERLKREWLKKNKPTVCPPAYLNIDSAMISMIAMVSKSSTIDRRFTGMYIRKGSKYSTQ